MVPFSRTLLSPSHLPKHIYSSRPIFSKKLSLTTQTYNEQPPFLNSESLATLATCLSTWLCTSAAHKSTCLGGKRDTRKNISTHISHLPGLNLSSPKREMLKAFRKKKKHTQIHLSNEYTHCQDDYIVTYCIPFINSTKTSICYFKGTPHSNYQF